jgi:hypothetical protein
MSDNEVESATRTIAAPPEDIWRVITDPRGHVAIDSSGMLMAAEDAKPVTAVGDEFVIHMDREALGDMPLGKYDVTNVVTMFEPYTHFEWAVGALDMPRVGHLYGYKLTPGADGTTEVTSYCDWSGIKDDWKQSGYFPVIRATTLRATLGILERVVQTGF